MKNEKNDLDKLGRWGNEVARREKNLGKWEKLKSKGIMSYIFKRGILCWGLILFISPVFLGPFIDYSYTFKFVYAETFKTKLIIFGILSPLVGILISYVEWKYFKKEYD